MTRRAVAGLFAATLFAAAVLSTGAASARFSVVVIGLAALSHLWLATRRDSGAKDKVVSLLVVGGAGAAALVWLFAAPPFSDDVYRYLVDGRLAAGGTNPFAYAPGSPKVADAVVRLGAAPNHGHLRTIYPPVAQALFAANGVLGGTLIGWRVAMILAALSGAVLASRVAPAAGVLPMAVAVATHPLVVVSAAGNGNVDVVGLPLVAAALLAASRARPWLASAVLGLAAGVKLFPGVLPAGLAGRFGAGRAVAGVGVAVAVLAASYAPIGGIGIKATGSLGQYVDTWEFNAPVAPVAVATCDRLLAAVGVPRSLPDPFAGPGEVPAVYYDGHPSARRWVERRALARRMVRAATGVALGVIALVCWRSGTVPAGALTALVLGVLVPSPVIHPWYLLWLLVPALVSRSGVAVTWCATVVLAFWAAAAHRDTGAWNLPPAVLVVEYAPVVALGSAALVRAAVPRAAGRRGRPGPLSGA